MSGPTTRHDADPDAEKATAAAHFEPNLGAPAVVDPAVERSVVRKLDHRIVPLVAFLCKSSARAKIAKIAGARILNRQPGRVFNGVFWLTNGRNPHRAVLLSFLDRSNIG
ncbi:uncharacterized protein PG998_008689 [Apiospora kogelbergensis]|uniref:Uncharacterized protein n=1 Tax=Apiospora kogelbergensis TaxID=1337665 RepID=A0AAW0QJL8_9PEZI